MATTNFINQQTVIQADWLNDVNNMTYVTGPGYSTSISALNSSKANAGTNTDITSMGTVTVPTQANGTANTAIANTLFVENRITNIPVTSVPLVPTRQTVMSGPVDASGLSSFGGSTGTTIVTASGTLIATAANGFGSTGQTDRVGSITNPSWTGLSTNGTMYLYLDIASNGTCTTGSTTISPIYQWGGTFGVSSGQFTFNIQSMSGQVGNGTTAVQTYRVFVGEVTVTGAVVTAITWYALMGRYDSGWFSVAANSTYTKNHNIGLNGKYTSVVTIADDAAGTNDRILANNFSGGAGYWQRASTTPRNQIDLSTAVSNVGYSTSGTLTAIGTAYYRILCARSF